MDFNASTIGILNLLSTSGIGPAKVNTILNSVNSQGIRFEEAIRNTILLRKYINANQLEKFYEQEEAVKILAQELNVLGIKLINILDEEYPESLRVRLGKSSPPLLAVRGNLSLFNKVSVGYCGSRVASLSGIAAASDSAKQLVENKTNIVSGYAAGIDIAVHSSALRNGGTTTIVLAEGIKHFKIKRELKDSWDWERVLVVSEFLPSIPWSIHNAMQRNNTICSLSNAVIVVEAGITGGSIAAGRSALRMAVPLFAPVYDEMPEKAQGIQQILTEGANPIKFAHGKCNIESVLTSLNHLDEGKGQQQSSNSQLSMF